MKLRRMKDIPVRGAVRAVQWKIDCKEISVHSDNLLQEIDILRRTDSPYVARCHAVFEKPSGDILFLMEYMDCGSFETLLKSHGTMFESNIADVARHVTKGLHYLHSKKIVHRDIKPANLLVNSMMEVKVADFRVSKIMGPTLDVCNSFVGTRAYMSPERFDPDNGQRTTTIGSLSSLSTLKLDNNDLTGFVPTTIGGLQKLQGLYLNGNKPQGFIPSEICKLDSLVDLFLANNKLSGSIPECLGNLDSLRTLSLNSTIPNALFSLVYILKLNLSSNSLVGSLPLDIENMKVVIAIDLSNNELSGNIPSTIGSLQNLINLSLAQNRFTGQIPTSFGELISIELMDLSKNNLSGEIPKSLEALLSLKHFNVSYNQLEGEIPTGGPFLNFSAQSFLSNNGLCGASRLQVLPCKREETHKSRNPTEAISVLRITLPVVSSIILILARTFLFMRYKKVKALKLSSEANLIFPPWRKISYEGLLEATNGFNEANLLGAGSFGSVYQGKLNDGLHVAIKVFNRNLEEAFKSFDAECELLFNLRHRNLIKILKTHNGNEFKALVLQFMSMGSLEKWLHNCDNSLNMLQRLNIMIDVASALEYLHHGYSQPVVHCDIKPSNILLDADMVAHVADFGISKMLGENAMMTQTKTLATIGYMAPEKEDRPAIKDCLASFMDLALNCSSDTPEKRKTMKDVLISLHKTKKKLLKEIQSI
nr:receptor kinase-like protein Xa21 [Ziziphus jujuba var. spinosa]